MQTEAEAQTVQSSQPASAIPRRGRRLAPWLKRRLSGLFALDTRRWRSAIVAMWLLDCAAIAFCALGMPTGLGTTFDVATALSLNTIALPIASLAVAALIALIGLRIPRATAGGAVYTGALLYFALYFTDFGIFGAIVYAAAFTLAAGAIGIALETAFRPRRTGLRIGVAAVAASLLAWALWPAADTGEGAWQASGEVQALASGVPDASRPGGYEVEAFTYGSGEDARRSEFGKDADIRSESADAGIYDAGDWPWLREKFWGFDVREETGMPLNGRVWMPAGEGPFPLVLMVHGNHLMEDFSDEGYAYLGELLASRGMIAVSVDENFLNYSAWSGIPDQDMKLRARMLLQHIGQLQRFNADANNRLYNRIDMGQVALLGHSRGGQAVAMAADPEQWFSEDESLPDRSSYRIRGVVAIAPTDTYVDGKQARLRDISYLTLQGAKDSDLVNFYGDRQYARTDIGRGSDAFKASLYIAGANHSQFNTAWGQFDNSYPGRLFVRPTGKLSPEAQRQVAKLYVSAFLETVFRGDDQYRSLFRDYRTGLNRLPDTEYFNQYQDGEFRLLTDFEGDDRARPATGVAAEATDMQEWRHEEAKNRQREDKGNQGLLLTWDRTAEYALRVAGDGVATDEDSILTFSIADLSDAPDGLRIQAEVKDRAGVAVRLPLSRFMDVQPPPKTDFTWLPGMESVFSEGKYKHESEAVYQTVELPLREFEDEDPDFTSSEWAELRLIFEDRPGIAMIDNVGIIP
ncbi:alpha/beta hydrolase [Cohnella sp. GCM10027633]|uniref:alpha/beta hydrolase n=1 Tax=unclassified Cohnella TaxID=2636738 RepID=UPI003638B85C